jgi:glutathione S-transferase
MMRLYHCSDARSFRVLWALEELGLPYELHVLPFPPRLHAPEYLTVNPLGTIPLFMDGPTTMTESGAIVQYLAETYGDGALKMTPADPAYGAWLNWLHFGEATLTFPQTLVLRYRMLEPEERRQPQVAADYAKWFLARLRGVEAALADGRDYLCADRFTAADISVGFPLLLAERIGLSTGFRPGVSAYWARLQTRESFRRAKAAQSEAAKAQGVEGHQLEAFLANHPA